MKNSALIILFLVFGSAAFLSFTAAQDQKAGGPWEIPAAFKNKQNPHKGDASLERLGRNGYARHCRSCHGRDGKGDGPMAAQLETFPGDFSKKAWQDKYNDGEIYYMSFIGRDEMPNFESNITDEEERWAIVNFVRSLKAE
jgi:mono/diheme cytochrome c family protein